MRSPMKCDRTAMVALIGARLPARIHIEDLRMRQFADGRSRVRFELSTGVDGANAIDDLVGQMVAVRLSGPNLAERHFGGIVRRVDELSRDERLVRFRCELAPPVWPHARQPRRRAFRQRSIPETIETVLANVAMRRELEHDYSVQELLVQQDETDWDFARRLMTGAGITYRFEHGPTGCRLVLSDATQAKLAPSDVPISGPWLSWRRRRQLVPRRDGAPKAVTRVEAVTEDPNVAPGAVIASSDSTDPRRYRVVRVDSRITAREGGFDCRIKVIAAPIEESPARPSIPQQSRPAGLFSATVDGYDHEESAGQIAVRLDGFEPGYDEAPIGSDVVAAAMPGHRVLLAFLEGGAEVGPLILGSLGQDCAAEVGGWSRLAVGSGSGGGTGIEDLMEGAEAFDHFSTADRRYEICAPSVELTSNPDLGAEYSRVVINSYGIDGVGGIVDIFASEQVLITLADCAMVSVSSLEDIPEAGNITLDCGAVGEILLRSGLECVPNSLLMSDEGIVINSEESITLMAGDCFITLDPEAGITMGCLENVATLDEVGFAVEAGGAIFEMGEDEMTFEAALADAAFEGEFSIETASFSVEAAIVNLL